MKAITLKCRWRAGGVSDTELPAVSDPAQWSSQDARVVAWAIQRALRAVTVYAIRLQETSPTTWRIETVANTRHRDSCRSPPAVCCRTGLVSGGGLRAS